MLMTGRVAVMPPTNCAPLERAEKRHKEIGEVRVAIGIVGTDVVELLVTPSGSTWSLIIVSPAGVACIALHGRSWIEAPVEEGERS